MKEENGRWRRLKPERQAESLVRVAQEGFNLMHLLQVPPARDDREKVGEEGKET